MDTCPTCGQRLPAGLGAFDPANQVPKTDEQAEVALRYGRPPVAGGCAVGIFQCRRLRGDALQDAYLAALEALLPPEDRPKRRTEGSSRKET